MDRYDILDMEERKCFDFFWNEASEGNDGYGLIRDNTGDKAKHVASLASVGFGLSAIAIGVEHKYVSKEEGFKRALGTLKTLYYNVEQIEGFFCHFVNIENGKREWHSEISIIDTSIAVMGAISAGEYFGGEIKALADMIYKRINWEWYTDKEKNLFYMGYYYERGFGGWWELYAEQMMMYVLGAASPTHPIAPDMYYSFRRDTGKYRGDEFIYTHTGSLFTYQFSHAWIDFRNMEDAQGVDWFKNSVDATLANKRYCMDNSKKYKTYNENAWGLTACETPHGYDGAQGAAPSAKNNSTNVLDGTVPPCGAIGSIVFTPEESIDAMNYFYNNVPGLWGKYGFKDAYNNAVEPRWVSDIFIGIDKGISLLMIENYKTSLIWKLTMKNEYIIKGLEALSIRWVEKDEYIPEKIGKLFDKGAGVKI